ncbi:MAG: hypothetical protein M1834_009271 [Cirrosporium novae-zelandiae]|nr:MAG: hypothetical protein M1834_009271 [Cirrosporium novae-zelandiae]
MFGFGGKTWEPETDIPDLSGKVILVTGGNTGLGKEAIIQLSRHSPKQIYMAARTPSKAETAIEDIKKAVPNAPVTFIQCDLTSFDSIKAAVESFKSQSPRLDVLMNNAGIMAVPPGFTKEHYEIQFGTNHMGHFLLTKLLMPTLLSTAKEPNADVRIISLASIGHQMCPSGGIIFDQEHLNTCAEWTRYGQSKLANILFAKGLAKHHPEITSVAVHPGVIYTDLYNSINNAGLFWKVMMPVGRILYPGFNVHDGTKNQLWASTVAKEELESGSYYVPVGKKNGGNSYARDEKLAEKLWDWSEKELAEKGF